MMCSDPTHPNCREAVRDNVRPLFDGSSREHGEDLRRRLIDHHTAPALDAVDVADDFAAELDDICRAAGADLEPTILAEAEAAVYGDRQADYGHPRQDFTRTAILWTGLLQHKLADGEHITPEDIARCQIAVKLARDVHAPKRDNRVDIAGYALTLDRLETGR